jgi:CO/xanthine dehydrogenase Mo-binding subunit
VAELAGKDPIAFRLELLERARNKPVGKENDYDPERYAGVLKLVRDKSNWKQANKGAPGRFGLLLSQYLCPYDNGCFLCVGKT